jgi:alpha-L-rhamnosidase
MFPPSFVPIVPNYDCPISAAIWGDVAVAGPWNIYQAFGDPGMLEDQFHQSQA